MITYSTLTGEVVVNQRITTKVVAFVHRLTPDGEWFFTRSDEGNVRRFPNRKAWEARRELMISLGYVPCDYYASV